MDSILKKMMARKGDTTYSMAVVAGMPQPNFHRILTGDATASAKVAEKIASHFGVEVGLLFNAKRYAVADADAPEPGKVA